MKECIFCKIVKKEIPADIIYEEDEIIVFQDNKPVAPVHILIISKKHISSVNNLESEDKKLIGQLILVAKKIAKKQGVSKTGYRLVINVGRDAGQTVDHLHLHLLGGKELPFS